MSETFESQSYRDESGLPIDWRKDANCRGLDPNMFHTARGESTKDAIAVCVGCIIVKECLHYAMTNSIKVGIWGGKSERERRKLRKTYKYEINTDEIEKVAD